MPPADEQGNHDEDAMAAATLAATPEQSRGPPTTKGPEGVDDPKESSDDEFESLLRQVARAPPIESSPIPSPDLEPGTIVDGCFRVVRPLGRGGMGVVYLADHLQLERQVALKLHSAASGTQGTSRLLREARTMARLVHDNVVTVYDVGTIDRQVYIAMEYVEGGTVRDWLESQPRSWAEIIEVFIAAGRGLVAAHEAGLVHRDFKPDNVLVGADGRVRVADFGLARAAGAGDAVPLRPGEDTQPIRPISSGTLSARTSEQQAWLTATGVVVGTPAYMAPEQYEGQSADARHDQYAYCVSLFESLYGERPFQGNTLMELVHNVIDGEPVEPSHDHDVPPFVRNALRRGLSRDPAARFPSMQGLISALEHDPAAARTRRWRLVAGMAAVAVTAGVVLRVADRDPCAGGGARLASVWDPARGDALERALAEHSGPMGAAVGPRVRARLDRYGEDWVQAYRDACEATHRREIQSEEALDLRMACLDVRREELAALAAVLMEGDEEVTARADRASLSLSSPGPCADVEALLRVDPIDAGDRPAAEALRRTLARAKEELDAGHYQTSQTLADQGLSEAEALGYASLQAEALHSVASARTKRSRHDEASQAHERSFNRAVAAGDDRLALRGMIELIYCDGYQRGRFELGERWVRQADAWLQRVDGDGISVVRLDLYDGLMQREQGRLADAVTAMERALARTESLTGEQAQDARRSVLGALAVTLGLRGDLEAALEVHAEALELAESIYGPDHPSLATEINNAAATEIARGNLERAERMLRRAWVIREESLGPTHPSVLEAQINMGTALSGLRRFQEAADILNRAKPNAADIGPKVRARLYSTLGGVYSELGRFEQSDAEYRQALAILREAQPPDPVGALQLTANLANLANRRGRHADAIAYSNDGLRAIEASSREGLSVIEGYIRLNLADAIDAQGDVEAACEEYTRALPLMEANLGREHAHLRSPLTSLAQCWLDAGEPQRAEPLLRRALPLLEHVAPGARVSTRLLLARALWEQGARQPAREMAVTARADAATMSEPRDQVDQWLRSHPK